MKNPVEEFLELKKEGGWLGNLWDAFKSGIGQQPLPAGVKPSIGEAMARGAGMVATPLAVTALGAGAIHGISKGVGAVRERFSKARDYQNMMSSMPSLQKEDAGQVQSIYNSLRTMSPTMAKDPLLAGSFVRDQLRMRTEEGPAIGPNTAKMLADTERSVAQSGKSHPIMDALSMSPFRGFGPPPQESPQPAMYQSRFPLEEGGYSEFRMPMDPEKARAMHHRAEQEFALRQMSLGRGEGEE